MSTIPDQSSENEPKTVMVTHSSHCGGTCLLRVHVEDGVVKRIDTDDGKEPQYRGCARGRAYRQRIYAPDRILHPLKRVGERGEGKFERISWDEALDTIAGEMTRVKEKYGPESILFKWSGGDPGALHCIHAYRRLLFMSGGCSEIWGIASFEGTVFAQIATYGTVATTSTRDNLLDARSIILWGWNPADTVMSTNTLWYLTQAKEAGTRITCVDPRYTNTAVTLSDEWIPIKPGTDTAMLVAMAYVIITEDLQDQMFLDKYTIGFEQYKQYLLGEEDGQAKTPQWAESITDVPAATIVNLAREYATSSPAALIAGIAPGRTAYGEQYHRAAATLAAMTGNVGVRGGDAGISGYTGTAGVYPFMKMGPGIQTPPNPVEEITPKRKNAMPSYGSYWVMRDGYVHAAKTADAILKGKAGGYPTDYKLFFLVNSNYLIGQFLNVNKCIEAAKALEFIVLGEQFMTPSAKFADIIVPMNTCMERNDITTSATVGYYGFMGQAIDSIGESKSHLEFCVALAKRLGIDDYMDKTEDELLRQIAAGSPHLKDYEAFKKAGCVKIEREEPFVAFAEEIEDPENNPFPTPSGKIEVFCQRIADMKDPLLPAIPKYIESWEGSHDPLARKYPLQLITTHFWRRANPQYDNIPWLKELDPQAILMNTVDAEAREIKDGDTVKVFNDRGAMVLPARVTERIMPGVVDVPQGAWYDPDETGIDRGGCANVLTKDSLSPAGAFPSNTGLVEIVKM